jgi:hypothetical protein
MIQDLLTIPDLYLTSQGNKRCSSLTKSELRFMHISTEHERQAMEYASVDAAKMPNSQSLATETLCNAIVVR